MKNIRFKGETSEEDNKIFKAQKLLLEHQMLELEKFENDIEQYGLFLFLLMCAIVALCFCSISDTERTTILDNL